MGGDSTWSIGLVFIGIFMVIVAVPCVGISYVGVQLMKRLGNSPSKTPAMQLSVLWQLVMIEIVSVTLLVVFYHLLAGQ